VILQRARSPLDPQVVDAGDRRDVVEVASVFVYVRSAAVDGSETDFVADLRPVYGGRARDEQVDESLARVAVARVAADVHLLPGGQDHRVYVARVRGADGLGDATAHRQRGTGYVVIRGRRRHGKEEQQYRRQYDEQDRTSHQGLLRPAHRRAVFGPVYRRPPPALYLSIRL